MGPHSYLEEPAVFSAESTVEFSINGTLIAEVTFNGLSQGVVSYNGGGSEPPFALASLNDVLIDLYCPQEDPKKYKVALACCQN